MSENYQDILIDFAFNKIRNNIETKACNLLANTSSIKKQIIYSEFDYPSVQILGETGSVEAGVINFANSSRIVNYNNILKQDKLNSSSGISIMLPELPDDFKKRQAKFFQTKPSLYDQLAHFKMDYNRFLIIDKVLSEIPTTSINEAIRYLNDLVQGLSTNPSADAKLLAIISVMIVQYQIQTNKESINMNLKMDESLRTIDQTNEKNRKALKYFTEIDKKFEEVENLQNFKIVKRKIPDFDIIKKKIFKIFNLKMVLQFRNAKGF